MIKINIDNNNNDNSLVTIVKAIVVVVIRIVMVMVTVIVKKTLTNINTIFCPRQLRRRSPFCALNMEIVQAVPTTCEFSDGGQSGRAGHSHHEIVESSSSPKFNVLNHTV